MDNAFTMEIEARYKQDEFPRRAAIKRTVREAASSLGPRPTTRRRVGGHRPFAAGLALLAIRLMPLRR